MLYGGFPWSESKMVLLISSSSLNEYHHLACGFHPALPSLRKYDNSINVCGVIWFWNIVALFVFGTLWCYLFFISLNM
jgi:hypothetical protein